MQEITFKHKNFKAINVLLFIIIIIFFLLSLFFIIDVYSINKKTIDDTKLYKETLEFIEEKGSEDRHYYIFKVKESEEIFRISNLYFKLQNEQNSLKNLIPDLALEFRVFNSELNNSKDNIDIISLTVSGIEFFSFDEAKSILADNSLIGVIVTGTVVFFSLITLIFLRRYNKKIPKTLTLTESFIAQSGLRNRIYIKNSHYKEFKGLICSLIGMILSFILIFLGAEIFNNQSFYLLLIFGGVSLFVVSCTCVLIFGYKLGNKRISYFCDLYDFKKFEDYSIKDNKYYDLSTNTVLKFEENGIKMSLPNKEDVLKFIKLVTSKAPTDKMLKNMEKHPPQPFEVEKEISLSYLDLDLFAQATYKNSGDIFTLCLVILPKKTEENLKKIIQLYVENEEQMEQLDQCQASGQ